MVILWIAAVVLMVLAALFVILPLRHYQRNPLVGEELAQEDHTLVLLRNELTTLEERHLAGDLGDAEYRDQRLEIERQLLADAALSSSSQVVANRHSSTRSNVLVPLLMLAIIPLVTIGLYQQVGGSDQLAQDKAVQALSALTDRGEQLAALEDIVRRWPNDHQSRYILGGIYMASERYQDAAREYETIVAQTGARQVEPMVQQAQALYLAGGNRITGQIAALVQQALVLAPEHPVVLSLAGIIAFERGEYRQAISHWQKMSLLIRDPQELAAIQMGIARAKEALGEPVRTELPTQLPAVPEANNAGGHVAVAVSLSPELMAQVQRDHGVSDWPATAKVFVFARSVGSTMPLAIVPLSVAKLPANVVLDDRSIMLDGVSFAGHDQVDIVARLSLTGEFIKAEYETIVRDVSVNRGNDEKAKLVTMVISAVSH